LGLTGAFQPGLARGDDDSEASVQAVRAVLDQQVRDWNKGNLDGFLTGYWNSPKVVFMSGGNRFDGFEAMRDRYRRRYKAEGKAMGELAFAELDVEPLGPESALARGRFRLSMPDGTKPTGLFTVILRKFPDGWKIVHDHLGRRDAGDRQARAAVKARLRLQGRREKLGCPGQSLRAPVFRSPTGARSKTRSAPATRVA
jgi:beta-aspartyl-peptidase (threonine type)